MSTPQRPVLIIGGSGVVGGQAAAALRRLQFDLPIAIGGRDLAKAQVVAQKVGGAIATRVDLDRRDLGQPEGAQYSAIVVFVKDDGLNSMRYAQDHGIPYISVSSGTFEIGPEVAQFIHAATKAPVLLASQWLAGAAVFPALVIAKDFRTIDSIAIGALLDEQDMGGPAALTDYNRITGAAPAALTLTGGKFSWVNGEDAKARYRSVDGVELDATAYSPLDIVSLAAVTDARSVRLDLAFSESASRRRGEPFSTEITIAIDGVLRNGERSTMRHEIVHPDGQAPLTALGVALAVERMLGLAGGAAPQPGLYLPESILAPDYYVGRMKEFGAQFRQT
ncbi:NAD(P)-dependent oxidoreductase [Bosea sp. 2YAB26]|uniref:NAD(P)-dependent oxidoreductase n=1 Tax=unclassified Bosea (in: a-proteobacteria) TaxID=2653178 RepID=UPI003F8EE5B4